MVCRAGSKPTAPPLVCLAMLTVALLCAGTRGCVPFSRAAAPMHERPSYSLLASKQAGTPVGSYQPPHQGHHLCTLAPDAFCIQQNGTTAASHLLSTPSSVMPSMSSVPMSLASPFWPARGHVQRFKSGCFVMDWRWLAQRRRLLCC